MGASFRNVGEITELAGCDYLTISVRSYPQHSPLQSLLDSSPIHFPLHPLPITHVLTNPLAQPPRRTPILHQRRPPKAHRRKRQLAQHREEDVHQRRVRFPFRLERGRDGD